MRRINTIEELKSERLRLLQERINLEIEIENDFREIKYYFSPQRLIPAGVSNVMINRNHGLINDGIGMMIDAVMRKVVLRKSGFLVKLIIPLIARNTATNLLAHNKDKLTDWLKSLFSKTFKKQTTEETLGMKM